MNYRRGLPILFLMVFMLLACEATDKGMGTTSDEDFTVVLQVDDRLVHVGDQVPLILRLRRTDNSNLEQGMSGTVLITTSSHGSVNLADVELRVSNETTSEFVSNLVFTAEQPGVAEVRATFLDATAVIKILISNVNI